MWLTAMIVTVSQYVTNDKMEPYLNGLLNKYISCIVISLTSQFYHLLAVETEKELLDVWHLDMCVRNWQHFALVPVFSGTETYRNTYLVYTTNKY